MNSGAVIVWIGVFLLLISLLFWMQEPDEPVIINNPDTVVVSDRMPLRDAQTVPAQVPTQYGDPVIVARTPTYQCAGVCTTACPGVVVPSTCPSGTICCT
jgi:hypothetical protein